MSSSEASSRCAAIFCALARSGARPSRWPRRRPASTGSRRCRGRRACCRCRPPAPRRPRGWRPSSSATICANVVSWPWPCDLTLSLRIGLAGRVDAQLGAVVHAQAGDVVVGAVAGADDLGERGDADSDQLALGPRLFLLPAEVVVAELLEREVHRRLVVARVVLEAGRGLVGELLRLDEVLPPELGRVDARSRRPRSDEALDQVRGLGDAERAAVGDAARRLVRVRARRLDVRRRDVVGAGDDVEEAGLALRRLRVGEERPVVGEHLHAQADDLPVLERQLAVHVVVAGEAGRDQVSGAVLDPLHRPADQERGRRRDDVAGVDRHLVAEAAAQVGRDDPDLLLGQARDEREERAVRRAGPATSCRWSPCPSPG